MSVRSIATVVCDRCGHTAEFELTEEQLRRRRSGSGFTCGRCKGNGRVVAYTPMHEQQQSIGLKCARCPELLSEERLRAMPSTRLGYASARRSSFSDMFVSVYLDPTVYFGISKSGAGIDVVKII